MSKRCRDPERHSSEGGSSGSPSSGSRAGASSSRGRRPRRKSEASRGRSSSSSSRRIHGKCKPARKTKKITSDSGKSGTNRIRSTEKKTRVEHFSESETIESGASGVKKRKKKNNQREGERKKKRKKRITGKKKLSGPSTCSRLIELLLESCSCLKSLDSSSSTSPNGDNTCCCKCRFCRPDCESKSVQCGDCENFVAPSRTRSKDEVRGSGKKESEEADRSFNCLGNDESDAGHKKNNCRLDFRGREEEEEEAEEAHVRSQKRKNKSETGICSSIVRSFAAFGNCGKPRISTKSLEVKIDDRNTPEDDSSKLVPASTKILKPIEFEATNCEVARRCRSDNRSKSTKALLIMFDIVFWPYTCLPGRRSFDNKNTKR